MRHRPPNIHLAPGISDAFEDPPEGDGFTMWIGGVIFPVLGLLVGIAFARAWMLSWVVFFVSAATVGHFHYFWGLTKYDAVYKIGKGVGLLGLITCISYWIFCKVSLF